MATRLFSYDNLPSAPQRIVSVDVERFKVSSYDIDNGYPQRMQALKNASPTAKMVCELYADFIFGQGFAVSDGAAKTGPNKEDGVWNMVLNSKGHTGDDLLSLAAADYSEFEKVYFHLNYNAMFQATELSIIPFEHVRYGIDERAGQVGVYDRWWTANRFGRMNLKTDNVDYIDLFNPDPQAIKQQVAAAGGWKNYKGQVMAFSKSFKNYPEFILDAGIKAMQAEIISYDTTKNNIQNNFGDKVLWIEKGEKQSPLEEEAFLETASTFVGSEGKQLMVSLVDSVDSAPEFRFIENKLDDKKFAYTDNKVRSTLYRLAGQNAILHSDLTEGRYNQNQLAEATKAYNNRTERARINMQRAFHAALFAMGIDAGCDITPINEDSFAINNTQGAGNGNNNPNNIPA